jgi:hypothetical protein
VGLVRQEAQEELRELEEVSEGGMAAGGHSQAKCRKEHILRRISKLNPGETQTLGAISGNDGIVTEPS